MWKKADSGKENVGNMSLSTTLDQDMQTLEIVLSIHV